MLLRLCSFLAPDVIPEWMLAKGAEHMGPLLASVAVDGYLLDQAVEALRAYSLLNRDGQAGMLSMHRLVQAVLRDAMVEEEETAWKQRVVELLQGVCPDVSKVEQWPVCEQWVAHAVVSATWLEEAALRTEIAAHVCNDAGYYLSMHGRWEEAELPFQQALLIRERILGEEHPDTAVSLNNLGMLYLSGCMYGLAGPLFLRTAAIYEKLLGRRGLDVGTRLGFLSFFRRKYVEPEVFFSGILMDMKRSCGPEHSLTVSSMDSVAGFYEDRGLYREAELLYVQALEARERSLGPVHPDTAMSLNNLAGLYDAQDRYAEAEPLMKRALGIWEQSLGSTHPSTRMGREKYVGLLRELGREEEAVALEGENERERSSAAAETWATLPPEDLAL